MMTINKGPEKILVCEQDNGQRLDKFLKNLYPHLGYGTLQKIFRTHQIKLDGKKTKADEKVQTGQEITLYFKVRDAKPLDKKEKQDPFEKAIAFSKAFEKYKKIIEESIIFENDELIVLNKPQGLAVQGGTKTTISLDALLKERAVGKDYTPRLTHRLDSHTTGLMIFAKTKDMARWITGLFRARQVHKIYWAITVGTPKKQQGSITDALGKMTGAAKEKMSSHAQEVKPAQTDFKILSKSTLLCLLELTPLTGRTHQLRVHCAESGFPILGDGKYGGKQAHPLKNRTPLCLHAHSLSLCMPDGQILTFEAALPSYMEKLMDTLV